MLKQHWKRGILFISFLGFLLTLSPIKATAVEFGAFGDIAFSDDNAEGERAHFSLGRLDLYALKKHEKITAFTEFLLEFDPSGGTAIDLERLWVQYAYNDLLRVSGGRFHTILGKWNREFHHGAHLYNSIDRPIFLNFEDDTGILPTHQIGILLDGRTRGGLGQLKYYFMIGNGSKINDSSYILDPNNVSDNNDSQSYSIRTSLAPKFLSGFELGLGGIFSTVSSDDGVADEVAQNIWEGDITYNTGNFEFLAEYYHMINRKSGQSHFNNMYFVQVAYTIGEDFVPYYRFEKQAVQETNDPYILAFNANPENPDSVQDYQKNIIGIRYHISMASSIKAETRFMNKRNELSSIGYAVQWTYAF